MPIPENSKPSNSSSGIGASRLRSGHMRSSTAPGQRVGISISSSKPLRLKCHRDQRGAHHEARVREEYSACRVNAEYIWHSTAGQPRIKSAGKRPSKLATVLMEVAPVRTSPNQAGETYGSVMPDSWVSYRPIVKTC